MNKFKKLAGPASSLGTVTLVLAIALVALFISNNGLGWYTKGTQSSATGMRVDVTSPDTPVESYRFMTVHSAELQTATDGTIYHRYAFTPLGKETAHMVMNNYSKLEAPTYHILLHVVLKEEVTKNGPAVLYMDTYIDGGTYTLNVADLPALAGVSGDSVGMSAALKFFVLTDGVAESDTVITEEKTEGEETVQVQTTLRWYNDVPGYRTNTNGYSFGLTTVPANPQNAMEVTQLIFSGMEEVEIPVSKGQRDIFIFITYDPERINLLQDYVSMQTGSGTDMGDKNFSFKSDFYIFFKDEKTGS